MGLICSPPLFLLSDLASVMSAQKVGAHRQRDRAALRARFGWFKETESRAFICFPVAPVNSSTWIQNIYIYGCPSVPIIHPESGCCPSKTCPPEALLAEPVTEILAPSCRRWIHTLLEEAENERMHLLTFLELKQPSVWMRMSVLLAQVCLPLPAWG